MSRNSIIENIKKYKLYEQLVLLTSRYSIGEEEKKYIGELIENVGLNWAEFLGCAMINRVNGVVYKNLKNYKNIPKYVMYFLKISYWEQKKRTEIHQKEIFEIADAFETEKINYSFLKGAVLNTLFYKAGDRISNDTDIMIDAEDIDNAVEVLKKIGYTQGYVSNGVLTPATKKEILFARLNTYEIVPLNKPVDERYLPFHEVDINFRLSNDDKDRESVEYMMKDNIILDNGGHKIKTLSLEKFLIFMCIHHYREATMIMKIAKGDDLTLYKFMDIHFFVSQNYKKINWDNLISISKEIGRQDDVYYTLYYSEMLYPGTFEKELLEKLKPVDISFLNQYKGKDNTDEIYIWKMDFIERVFSYKRKIEAMENIKEENERYNGILEQLKK